MILTEIFEILNEGWAHSKVGYNAPGGKVVGSTSDWLVTFGVTPEEKMKIIESALDLLRKTPAWKQANDLGLRFISSKRELQNGTLAFDSGIEDLDLIPADRAEHLRQTRTTLYTYVYNIYANGQIRTYLRDHENETSRVGITRLKSPKPTIVVDDPVRSLARTWENALEELVRKFKEKLRRISKRRG